MPGPSSVTRSETDCGVTTASITTRVPAGVWETALFTTLHRACSIKIASARDHRELRRQLQYEGQGGSASLREH